MKSTETIGCPGIFRWKPFQLKVQKDPFRALLLDPEGNEVGPWIALWQNKLTHKTSGSKVHHIQEQVVKKKRVSFGQVLVRTYNRTIGDNPCCLKGVPISLGWEYKQMPPLSLNHYERCRKKRTEFLLSPLYRELILLDLGFSKEEIKCAYKEKNRIQRQRKSTSLMLPFHKFGAKLHLVH